MKKIFSIGIIALLLLPAIIKAQSNPLDGYLEKYAEKPGFYFLDLKTNMVSSSGVENAEDNDKIVFLKMLTFEENDKISLSAVDFYNLFSNKINKENYIGLVEVKSSEDNVEILVKKDGKSVSEFIITRQEEKEVTILAATGNFDLKDLAKMKDFQNCKGLEVLAKMCED